MTIKDIIYLKSANPITILDKPSSETKEFVAKIITSPQFSEFTKTIRKLYGFPENGLDIKKYVGKKLGQDTDILTDTTVWSIYLVVNEMKRSIDPEDGPIDQMMLLIIFNACIDLDYFTGSLTRSIDFIVGKKNIATAMFDYPYEIGAILLPYISSKRQLFAWIDKNWNDIESKMDSKLLKNPYLIRIHKNTELAVEIVDLKDNQHKSFSKISTILTDKYPEDKRLTDEVWIKDTYYFAKEKSLQSLFPQF